LERSTKFRFKTLLDRLL